MIYFTISLIFSIFAAKKQYMERFIMQDLIAWKNREDRKPLILLGARQVGKTYILKEFGQREFENVAYINCDNNAMAKDLFASDYNIDRILLTIGAITGVNIEAGKTLIIMDEIQELYRGLASLKYFCENAREYHVAVAGSLLGLSLHQGESYPVGKVNTLEMYPMTFEEFLWARGFKQRMDLLQHGMWDVVKSLRTLYIQHLREYYLVGGMPEAVNKFIETNDANAVREVQEEIIRAYEKDISKHAPKEQVVRINQVWNSIPSQLAKENKKFIYGIVKQGARAKDYELAIQWLIDAGLVYKISRVKTLGLPLKIHEDISAFKLYLLDCGLLGAMSKTPPALLLLPSNDNTGKGDFTENFVCCQLESLHQIPTKKISTKKLKPLTYIKYAVLLFMVALLPMLVTNDVGMGDPFFCKYLCPQGVLEGAIPLAAVNSGIRAALGALFSWKLGILIAVIVLSVLFYRPFCKWLCPLGAFYALLNRVSLFGMKVDQHKCISCGKCARACKMDVDVTKTPNHAECIRCGMCVRACPTHAVSFRYGFGKGKEVDCPAKKAETSKQLSDTEKE